jgi:hypothetical protein
MDEQYRKWTEVTGRALSLRSWELAKLKEVPINIHYGISQMPGYYYDVFWVCDLDWNIISMQRAFTNIGNYTTALRSFMRNNGINLFKFSVSCNLCTPEVAKPEPKPMLTVKKICASKG